MASKSTAFASMRGVQLADTNKRDREQEKEKIGSRHFALNNFPMPCRHGKVTLVLPSR